MTFFAPKSDRLAALKDVARDFDGTGEGETATLTHTDTRVSNGSVEPWIDAPTASRTNDNETVNTSGATAGFGLTVKSDDVIGFNARISDNTVDPQTATIVRDSDGTELASKDVSSLSSGDTFSVEYAGLQAGTQYRLLLTNGGDYGQYDSASYPVDTEYVTLDEDIINGNSLGYLAPALNDVEPIVEPADAEVIVEFGTPGTPPADAVGWDVAYFKATTDGESVDVYVQEDQDAGGWTDVAGPINRGGSIPADPENDVRFRVEFHRDDRTNDPTLDSILRRYKL